MKISIIMCISKVLTDLYAIEQRIKMKNIFANVVYNVLVVSSEKILIQRNTKKIA